MNLNRYEIFLKVAELGNITRAADVLHYTQAGVSHAVSALENEVGVPLLVRGATGVTLTESAKQLLPAIRTLVNDQRSLAQAIYEINNRVAGTLRLGTFTSVCVQWLPNIIKGFQKKYPDVEFEIKAGDYDESEEFILSGEVDCGFVIAPADKNLRFVPLYRDPMLVLMPKGHPLAEKEFLTLSDLKKEPLIVPVKGYDTEVHAILKKNSQKTDIRYSLNDDLSVISMVAHGFGISVMAELILKESNFDIEIRPLDPPQYRSIGIASFPPERVSVLTRTFVNYLAENRGRDFCLPL